MAATTPYSLLVAGTTLHSDDYLTWLNVHDTTQSASGSVLKISITNFLATLPAPITLAAGTVTVSTPVFQATETWNDAAVTFTGIDLNITSTASAAASLLANLRVGGTSQWKVTKAGASTQLGLMTSVGVNYGSGTLIGSGDVTINTNKFTITAASGNFVSAGTGQVATTLGVGAATPAASGAGITFPASLNASSDVNTLDDYKEGTWTPNIGGTATYSSQVGTYTKIGRMVEVTCFMRLTNRGTGSTNTLSGLPFPVVGGGYAVVGNFDNLAINTILITIVAGAGTSTATFRDMAASGAAMSGPSAIFGNATTISFTLWYEAAT